MQRHLLTLSAVAEGLTGLALMAVPALTISLLLGLTPGADALMIGRIAGVALLALGLTCWGARDHTGSTAVTGTLNGMTFYNCGAGAFLIAYLVAGKAGGTLVLVVGILHLMLGAGFAMSRWIGRAH